MRHIGCHKMSRRDFSPDLELNVIQSRPPVRFDVRLNGRCNLQCVMCGVWKQPNGLYNESDFWTIGPTDIFPHLKEIDVLGGEPFVQSDTFRLIDEISSVNSTCSWAFVTNGNYKFNNTIRTRLDRVAIRWFQLSLDSLNPEVYAQIRLKGELARALSTLEELRKYRIERKLTGNDFRIIVSMCVQKLNWTEIPAFLDFCISREIEPILQFAYYPPHLSLLDLSIFERKKIEESLRQLLVQYGPRFIRPIFTPLRESLKTMPENISENHV